MWCVYLYIGYDGVVDITFGITCDVMCVVVVDIACDVCGSIVFDMVVGMWCVVYAYSCC